MKPSIDEYLAKINSWREETLKLREILLSCGLTEELKWYQLCYTFENKNVVIIGRFKEYCTLSFFKGALLDDPHNLLSSPGPNSQAVRMIKFTGKEQIIQLESILRKYILAATELEKQGKKVVFKKVLEYEIPEELKEIFLRMPELRQAFESLTPGRQRAYLLYFSAPVQSKTRTSRIEKFADKILSGKGLND
ncbi:MAG: hypothetical protein GX437_04555 [Sphingobacteriales bacterium]|nr:hypothetical protein [Sphingobacteriales bacterium]